MTQLYNRTTSRVLLRSVMRCSLVDVLRTYIERMNLKPAGNDAIWRINKVSKPKVISKYIKNFPFARLREGP